MRVACDGLDKLPLLVVLVRLLARRGVDDRVSFVFDALSGSVVPRDFEQGAAALDDHARI